MRQTIYLRAPRVTLGTRSLQVVVAPCWEMALPDIIPARLASAPGPIPRRLPPVPLPISSRRASASAPGKGAWQTDMPYLATSTGAVLSRLQSFASLQAPTLAWPPGCTHRGHLHIHPGGRAVYTTHSPDGYPRGVWHRYVTDVGQLSRLDFHQLACSLVGCSFPGPASRPACQVSPSRAPRRLSLLPACPPPRAVCSDPSPTSTRRADPAQCPDPAALPWAAVRAALVPLYPRGPWLRSEFCCLGPSSLTPTPCAGLAGTRRLHGPAAYTPRLRCAGAPRRPARPSLLSLPSCPCVPSTLRRWVRGGLPVV